MDIKSKIDKAYDKANELMIDLIMKQSFAVSDLIVIGGIISAKAIAAHSLGDEKERNTTLEKYIAALKFTLEKNFEIIKESQATPDLLKKFMDDKKVGNT